MQTTRNKFTVSQHYTQAQLSVFLSFISIFVVIWLGVLLFSLLRKVNHVWAIWDWQCIL